MSKEDDSRKLATYMAKDLRKFVNDFDFYRIYEDIAVYGQSRITLYWDKDAEEIKSKIELPFK